MYVTQKLFQKVQRGSLLEWSPDQNQQNIEGFTGSSNHFTNLLFHELSYTLH